MGGGIDPRIALGGQLPQIEGPLDLQKGALGVQELINAVQLQKQQQANAEISRQQKELELKQANIDFQDQQTIRSLMPQFAKKDANGVGTFDWEGLANEAANRNINPKLINAMQKDYLGLVEQKAKAGEAQLTNETAHNKAAYEILEGLRSVKDPVERQQALNMGKNRAALMGVDVSQWPMKAPDDNGLDVLETQLGMHGQILADAKTVAETNKAKAEEAKATAEAAKFKMEAETGANIPLDKQAYFEWKKNPSNANKTIQDFQNEQELRKQQTLLPGEIKKVGAEAAARSSADIALLNRLNQQSNQSGRTVAPGMSPDTTDQAATTYHNTGNLPAVGRGAAGVAQRTAIMNREREMFPNTVLSADSQEFKANADSLKKLQPQFDQVTAFENTAKKNLKLFTDLSKKAIDSGVPLINMPLRMTATSLGAEDTLALNAARQVAINEIAKVTSNPGLSGQLSDTARKEVEAFIPQSATYGQALRVAGILTQDMDNRYDSMSQQIEGIKKRLQGANKSNSGGGELKATHRYNPSTGKIEAITSQ